MGDDKSVSFFARIFFYRGQRAGHPRALSPWTSFPALQPWQDGFPGHVSVSGRLLVEGPVGSVV